MSWSNVAEDLAKLVDAYLTLWKALDIYFPEHTFLEVAEDSESEVLEELRKLASEDFAGFDNPGVLRAEVQNTVRWVERQPKDQSWRNEARLLKESFQDKALQYAARLPDPPPLGLAASAD